MLKIMKLFIFALLCFQYVCTKASDRAVLVNNTMKEIDGVTGKMHLELIRVGKKVPGKKEGKKECRQ